MKVIDLLNKIANDEITELHKFKWDKRIWEEYSKFEEINNDKSYQEHRENGTSFMRFENICDTRHFNDEIEIIEEKPKKIEELKIKNIYKCDDYQQIYINFKETFNKINEIIDYLLEKESDK